MEPNCINPNESLIGLYQKRSELIRKKRIGHNNPFVVESVRIALSDINNQIGLIERAAQTGNIIRLV